MNRQRGLAAFDLTLLAPLVLLADLLLLLGSKVVLDVECGSDLLWGLTLDHVGDSLAGQIKERLDIQKVGSQNELKENALLHRAKLLIPGNDIISSALLLLPC